MNNPATPATNPNGNPPEAPISIQDALVQANAHWNAGQAEQAEVICQRILSIWPGQSDALHLMGLMAHAFNHSDLAIGYLRKASEAPRAPAIYLSNLAEMLRQKGSLLEAEEYARRALQADNTLPAIWNNLGIILQEVGKLDEARLCLEKLLSLEPKNPRAHNNLANTFKHLGKFGLAKTHWLKALEIDPEYPEPYSNLANLLGQMAQHDEAIAYSRKAIELNPRQADAYLNIAAIETSRNRHAEALHWLESLLSFAPNHINGLSAKALSLMHLDQHEEALSCINIAVTQAPQSAEAVNARGFILQAMGNSKQAIEAFKVAATLPGLINEKAITNLALLHMQDGETDEANRIFDQALAAYPTSANIWFNRSDLTTFKPGDPAIAKMEEVLGAIEFPTDNDKLLMHFALGKAYLDIGESEKAFAHLNLGNQMKRATFSFNVQTTAQWLNQIKAVFTKDYIEQGLSQAPRAALDAPIFIIGMPRSGTSLIEQILASHPAVHGAGELKYVQRIVDGFGSYPNINPPLNSERSAALGAEYLKKITPLSQGRTFVVDKMPANFLHAGFIHMMLPHARIIHCQRNPVDTCLSLYSKIFGDEQMFAYDLTELGQFHLEYESLTDHWRKVIPASHFTDIQYESVVDDIEAEARRLLDFLGLPWDPACLDFYKTKRTVKTASTNQVRQPVYKSSSGRWRKHAAQLQPLLKALGIEEQSESESKPEPESKPESSAAPATKTKAVAKPKSAAKPETDAPAKKTVKKTVKPAK